MTTTARLATSFFSVCILTAMLSGCETVSRNVPMQSCITLSAEKENKVKVSQLLEIVLGEVPSIPYRWFYRVSDEKAVRLLYHYDVYDPGSNPRGVCGAGSVENYFYFVADSPGEYEIEFQHNYSPDGFQTDWRKAHLRKLYKLTVN